MTYTPPNFEARSLHVHEIVAEMIGRDASVIERAKSVLLRWIGDGTSASQRYFAAWLQAIEEGPDACLRQMLDPSEWGDVMRSCSPFECLLSVDQRRCVLATYRRAI